MIDNPIKIVEYLSIPTLWKLPKKTIRVQSHIPPFSCYDDRSSRSSRNSRNSSSFANFQRSKVKRGRIVHRLEMRARVMKTLMYELEKINRPINGLISTFDMKPPGARTSTLSQF